MNAPEPQLSTLCQDVQFNCAVSDARYARDYSLCIYLLRMREFYRWQFELPLTQPLAIDTVGDWISEMELYWDDIEESSYKPVVINGLTFDPFESDAINQQLHPLGLIYSAGYGRLGQPHFVLAELLQQQTEPTLTSYDCGKELARDSITLPAMAQQQSIYIRHDSIKRHIWQMVDEWRLQKNTGPMARIVGYFQLTDSDTLDTQIDKACKQLSPLYLEHERGEVAAGKLLGERFHQQLANVTGAQNEFYLRAVRDILADSLTTWPYILKQSTDVELDFWLASVAGARVELLQASGLTGLLNDEAAQQSRYERLRSIIKSERQRWLVLANALLTHCERDPRKADIRAQCLSFFEAQ